MQKDYEINSEQLIIKTAIPFQSLHKMEICHDVNAHAIVMINVIMEEEDHQEVLSRDWSDTTISVLKKGEEGLPLFSGRIEKIVCHKEGHLLTVQIWGIGETAQLDREKKKQSFQNIEMTYRQVIQEVIKHYQETESVWNIRDDKSIGDPLIQYNETDWEFLMRLCSHFHEMLIPDMQNGKWKVHFGIPAGQEQSGDEVEILGNGFNDIYYHNGCYEMGMSKSQTFYMKVKSKKNWQMGDFLIYEGRKCQVYSRRILFENGALFFIYQLGMRGMYYSPKIYNNALSGVRLEGIIRKTEAESVYIQLDIDGEERADFPWKWTPETNNISYCMPETGTRAVLYLPAREEKAGRVILSTVHNTGNEKYTDVQKREFTTKYHKKIGLYPDRLFAEGTDGNVSVYMDDESGIRIKSHADISLLAKGNIILTGKNIKAFTPMELACQTVESNIELCRDINLYAPGGVKTIGTGAMDKNMKKAEEGKTAGGQEIECWQAAFSAVAAVPGADLGKVEGTDSIMELFTCGGVPKVAGGASVIALSEVMSGQKESKCSFPNVFKSMDNYTVKGGYALPEEEIN
ncbi:MAG: hypothetical protein NC489_27895 [Ruminococcus flavefaciens]|nr:hypothetical protein [Ruminococcus flavefaciens]